ncbi:MAG: SDR family NAD(P)-dependent oxidoreductase [Rhizobiaceae bacterium]
MTELEGKVAVVTGATSMRGLGKAVAERLVKRGATVVVTGLESEMAGAGDVVAALQDQGGVISAVAADVTNPEQIDAAIAEIKSRHGGIDILINNAGVGFGSPVFAENDAKAWDLNYAVNVKGAMAMCRAVLPVMETRGGGAIVNVASLAGLGAMAGMPYPYTATKFALIGVTKQLALECAANGVRVNVVAPGAIATDMLAQAYEAIAEAEGVTVEEAADLENATIPLGRPAEPDEVAEAIAWLASPAAAYVTGVALPVAGGMAAGL